jgi:nitrogen fixation protein FixH
VALIRKDRIWPTIIVASLASFVGLSLLLARVAERDRHFAVESDYYTKAVGWDSTMAQAGRNTALGWQVVPRLGAVRPGVSDTLVFELRDRFGAPIRDAEVSVEAMPVAYADQVVRANLRASAEPGRYAASVAMSRAGLWELRVSALRGSDRFTANLRIDASAEHDAVVIDARPGEPVR